MGATIAYGMTLRGATQSCSQEYHRDDADEGADHHASAGHEEDAFK
jgi:hypothetical protein